MALGDLSGRARVRYPNWSATGVCDRCGFRYQLDALKKQFAFGGTGLYDTGYLVCRHCLDVPNQQNRALILPPDPIPRVNPRPDFNITAPAPATTPDNQGFTQYILGAPYPGLYPTTKSAVLAQVATLSGIPTPVGIVDRSTVINPANVTINLMNANPARTWLLLYNPVTAQAQISMTIALWGTITNLILGPGEAYFWATSQGFGTVYQGALTIIGLTPQMNFWGWEA